MDKKNWGKLNFLEPPAGLFDRIILAIKREKELRNTQRLVFGFFFLLVLSLVTMYFSGVIIVNQMQQSGVSYFLSAAMNNLDVFMFFWQDLSLAVLESLPIVAIAIFLLSIAFVVFSVRLFLHRKKLLFNHFINNFAW